MSGGKDRKSRSSKTQGWEEAGGEFYQESYPGDLENMQRDPAEIATLLPSKQNRAATTRRVRPNQQEPKSTRRRQQQTTTNRRRNSTTVRRGSQYHEVQVSMLPDLSQDLTDEERIWEEIHEIKSMPVSMAQKKELKAQLQNATKLRLQGFDQIKWQRRKAWQQFESKWSEIVTKMELWRNPLKRIEGNFGTGVVAYFLFLRWLMFLNLCIFILILTFIVIPHVTLNEPKDLPCDLNLENNSTQCCHENYVNKTTSEFYILDIIQGTGFMEKTLMFYGMYTNKIFGYHPYEKILSTKTNQLASTLLSSSSSSAVPSSSIQSMNEQLLNDDLLMSQVIVDEDDSRIINSSQYQLISNIVNDNDDNTASATTDAADLLTTNHIYYDLPLAYISITAIYFLISLAAIVKAASHEFKDRLVDGEGQFYQYCNLVFGGWDFCIHNEKSSYIKHKALYNEIKGLLHSKRMEYERHNRSRDFMCKIIIIRLIVNIFVIIILALSALIIYYLFNMSLKYVEPNFQHTEPLTLFQTSNLFHHQQQQSQQYNNSIRDSLFIINNNNNSSSFSQLTSSDDYSSSSSSGSGEFINYDNNNINARSNNRKYTIANYEEQLQILFFEFLPYIAIVCLNLLIPILFNYLCEFEQYSPMFVIKISLLRTVFLRLSSLAVLLSRFYFIIIPKTGDNQCYHTNTGTLQCWETFVGQQFYKLVITDFVTHFFVTFFINFPRSLIAKHVNTKFARLIGEQEFELSKHVLDVVYSQTLCWLGSFYAPFLPAIATILTFFMFYIKKFQCLVNSKPSGILYRASRSNSLFMFILLLSYVIAVVPVVYAIAEIMPSRSCGPFRGLNSVWDAAILAFMKMPSIFQEFIFFLGTAGFAIPCFIVLTLFLYYYYAVSDANKHMVEVLKNQLVLEGHDKQFLLNRLSSFIKQQQDFQKKMRQFDLHQQQLQQPPPLPPQHQSQPHSREREQRNSRDRNRVDNND